MQEYEISFRNVDKYQHGDPDDLLIKNIQQINPSLLKGSHVFSAFPIRNLDYLKKTGTYRIATRRNPELEPNSIFCCEYNPNVQKLVAGTDYLVERYVDEHSTHGKQKCGLAVYELAKLKSISASEFQFIDDNNRLEALTAIIVLSSLGNLFF